MSYYEVNADKENYCNVFYHGKADARAHFHSAVELLLVESGEQEVVVGGQKRLLKGGEGCFCDAFSTHAYMYNRNALTTTVIGDKVFFERAFALFGEKVPPKFFAFDDFTWLKIIVDQVKSDDIDNLTQVRFEGFVHFLLSKIAENNAFVTREKSKQDALICRILSYTESHLHEDLSLETLGRVFHYSREHLSRLAHKYLSENWQNYVNRLRVRKAANLLAENPKENVMDVALSCGFDSPNTFYRAYKKEFGHSPKKK